MWVLKFFNLSSAHLPSKTNSESFAALKRLLTSIIYHTSHQRPHYTICSQLMPIPNSNPLESTTPSYLIMDTNTHIMLDLECTSVTAPNPCIIEIGAVCFDLNTGHEYGHYRAAVNLQSCTTAGLVTDQDTMDWLAEYIPQKLQASQNSHTTISQALEQLSTFLDTSEQATKHRLVDIGRANSASEIRVWGNGATVDNVWIASAYKANGLRKPWKNICDMCVKTLVRNYSELVGRNFAREEVFQGTKHDAIDDARHQIRYLVKSRKAVLNLMASGCGLEDTMSSAGSGESAKDVLMSTRDSPEIETRFKRRRITTETDNQHDECLLPQEPWVQSFQRTLSDAATSSPEYSPDTSPYPANNDDSQLVLLGSYIYPPGIVADHPSEYTRDQDFKVTKYSMGQTRTKINATPSLQASLDAINVLPLTPEEQAQIRRGSSNNSARSSMRNIEFGRALTFSPNFQSMIKDHQVSLLNGWGLGIDHESTCLTVPGEWISSTPDRLYRMWLKNTADVLTRFIPKVRNEQLNGTYQRAMFRVDSVRLRDHGTENQVSADSTKARIFATVGNASAGKVLDTDKSKHASHACGNPYCLIPRHINMEDPNLNYQRDGCRLRALEMRKKGAPVPWKCGIHGPGEADCLMQLMVLTNVERMNLQLSLQLGHPLPNPIQDPKHFFPSKVRSFEDFDGGFNFGPKDPSLNRLMSRYYGEREQMPEPKACCPLCERTWLSASVVPLNHLVKDHASHEGFVSAILQMAEEWASDFNMWRKGSKPLKATSVIGRISQLLLENKDTLDRDQAIHIIKSGQKSPKKRVRRV